MKLLAKTKVVVGVLIVAISVNGVSTPLKYILLEPVEPCITINEANCLYGKANEPTYVSAPPARESQSIDIPFLLAAVLSQVRANPFGTVVAPHAIKF